MPQVKKKKNSKTNLRSKEAEKSNSEDHVWKIILL